MDDSLFARCGYDPARIFARIYGHQPTGIVRLGAPPAEPEPPEPPPPPEPPEPPPVEVKAEEPDDPPRDGGTEGVPEEQRDPAPTQTPAPSGEAESIQLVREWLGAHWKAVEAMARAGEAPRDLPPGPHRAEPAASEPAPPPTGPPEPLPPPYVEPGDRWTKWKMARFLRQLAATQNVAEAARAVNMSRQSAYKLRSRLKGQPFDIAWEAAFRHGYDNLAHSALELALAGEEVPHYYQGELVATHVKRNPQLIVQLLRMRNRAGAPMLGRYGAAAEFWSERWEQMTHRVETGSVTWSDERAALGAGEAVGLDGPGEQRRIAEFVERNRPDE